MHLSLSHSRRCGAWVWGRAPGPLGLDLEAADPGRNWEALARESFQPGEAESLAAEAAELNSVVPWARAWTRKEAWIKQQGLTVWDLPKAPREAEADQQRNDRSWQVILGPGEEFILSVCWPAGHELESLTLCCPENLILRRLGPKHKGEDKTEENSQTDGQTEGAGQGREPQKAEG